MEAKFTVFYSNGFLTDGDCGCHALVDFLREEVVGLAQPIAWAPVGYWEWARENRGRDCDDLRAESIAAGRVIELRDGKYIPLGVTEEAPKQEEEVLCNGLTAAETDATASVMGIVSKPAPEPQRPALDWNESTRTDRWADFIVQRGAVKHDEYNPPERVLHPLQRIAQEGDPIHGSAFLRKGA